MSDKAVLEGILLGLTLAVLLGPVFFALLQTALNKGFLAGLSMALGVMLGDAFLIFLSYLGLSQIMTYNQFAFYFGLGGGILLIIFGIITFRKKIRFRDMRPSPDVFAPARAYKRIAKGFILNISNPFLWIFWISVVSAVHSSYGGNFFKSAMFFISALSTVFLTDVLKIFLSHKVKRLIRPKTMVIINRTVGVLMMFLGVILLVRVFYNFS